MVELSSLQQILSMSSGPEKVQQVQQQQPDVQGRQFAAEFREIADTQKNQVQGTEEGNQSKLVGDKKESEKDRRERKKRRRDASKDDSLQSGALKVEEVRQGRILDITI